MFEISKSDGSWEITSRAFVGDNVGIVSVDGANSRAYISLEHGHFGTKVHRSDDKGANWVEVSCPEYPEQPEGWVEAPNAFAGKVTPGIDLGDRARSDRRGGGRHDSGRVVQE